MKEADIEARLVRLVREGGGLCYKFVSPGNAGVPDRIVVTPSGRTIFVELKKKSGRLSALQRRQIQALRLRGADARVLYGMEQVRAFAEEVMPDAFHTAQLPAVRDRADRH